MEKGTQYSGFIEEPTLTIAATSCQCSTTLQWTTSSRRASETAWSMSPFSFTPNNQPCFCLRRRNMQECSTSKIKTTSNFDSTEPSEHQEASLSKNLKFGIERILTQSFSLDSSDDVKELNAKTQTNKLTISGKSRRKNGTRSVFSHVQRNILELHYQQREYVTKGERYHIAMATGISEEQVKIWFQNRRTKKKKMERNKISASEKSKPENCNINIMDLH